MPIVVYDTPALARLARADVGSMRLLRFASGALRETGARDTELVTRVYPCVVLLKIGATTHTSLQRFLSTNDIPYSRIDMVQSYTAVPTVLDVLALVAN